MPWKECSVMDERMQFVARRLAGEPMAGSAGSSASSRKTGYKIFDRYQECGIQGLTDRSRRPYRFANQLPFNVKHEHTSWGARKTPPAAYLTSAARLRCPPKCSTTPTIGSGPRSTVGPAVLRKISIRREFIVTNSHETHSCCSQHTRGMLPAP